mmetsp:Transcript_150/g.711  ORF Transcript_150/g.711 Transcript_150/m.711 type:complete len:287 (-) Transcript_150:282-1142(-)
MPRGSVSTAAVCGGMDIFTHPSASTSYFPSTPWLVYAATSVSPGLNPVCTVITPVFSTRPLWNRHTASTPSFLESKKRSHTSSASHSSRPSSGLSSSGASEPSGARAWRLASLQRRPPRLSAYRSRRKWFTPLTCSRRSVFHSSFLCQGNASLFAGSRPAPVSPFDDVWPTSVPWYSIDGPGAHAIMSVSILSASVSPCSIHKARAVSCESNRFISMDGCALPPPSGEPDPVDSVCAFWYAAHTSPKLSLNPRASTAMTWYSPPMASSCLSSNPHPTKPKEHVPKA